MKTKCCANRHSNSKTSGRRIYCYIPSRGNFGNTIKSFPLLLSFEFSPRFFKWSLSHPTRCDALEKPKTRRNVSGSAGYLRRQLSSNGHSRLGCKCIAFPLHRRKNLHRPLCTTCHQGNVRYRFRSTWAHKYEKYLLHNLPAPPTNK